MELIIELINVRLGVNCPNSLLPPHWYSSTIYTAHSAAVVAAEFT